MLHGTWHITKWLGGIDNVVKDNAKSPNVHHFCVSE